MLPMYILITAFVIQLLYILVNWYFFRRKEYIYYSVYILVILLYFLNRYIADENGMHHIGTIAFSKMIPDRILCIFSYIFYFKFGRLFVEVKDRYPGIDKMMIITEKILLLYIGIDLALKATARFPELENNLFLLVNISIFIVLIVVFKTMLKKNELLDRFILTGSMFYAVTALITLWLGRNKSPLYDDHMLALQIGALVEMVFLNAGLVYKSRMLQRLTINSQEQLIEHYEKNQELLLRLSTIRERISRDLHDDVGASLSSIKAYSEILKSNPENTRLADLISNNSTEMIESLELIAWTTNPAYDQMISLKNMILKFANPICHARNIEFQLTTLNIHDDEQIPGEIRQNILMICKESINNMIKYADARNCEIKFEITQNNLIVSISDDGKGFDGTIKGTGNGLINMNKRARDINGELLVKSDPSKGTLISLQIPYPFKIPVSWGKRN